MLHRPSLSIDLPEDWQQDRQPSEKAKPFAITPLALYQKKEAVTTKVRISSVPAEESQKNEELHTIEAVPGAEVQQAAEQSNTSGQQMATSQLPEDSEVNWDRSATRLLGQVSKAKAVRAHISFQERRVLENEFELD